MNQELATAYIVGWSIMRKIQQKAIQAHVMDGCAECLRRIMWKRSARRAIMQMQHVVECEKLYGDLEPGTKARFDARKQEFKFQMILLQNYPPPDPKEGR